MPKIQVTRNSKTGKEQHYINIPKEKILAKGWKKGDLVDCNYDEKGRLILTKVSKE